MRNFNVSIPVCTITRAQATCFYLGWAALGLVILLAASEVFRISSLLANPLMQLAATAVILLGCVIFAYVPYRVAIGYFQQGQILLTPQLIGLPPSLLGLGPARWCSWSDLTSLSLSGSGRRIARLSFGRKSLTIDLEALKPEDAEQVLLCCEVFAPQAVWAPDLAEYRDALQNRNRGISGTSYTQLWQEELSRRFSPTTFVPHAPGTSLCSGRFTVTRQLAFGGFSSVYLACDSNETPVVLKEFVTPQGSPELQEKALELFCREAEILAALSHPQIARVLDRFVENGRQYLVLEHVRGRTLRQLVQSEGPVGEASAWGLARQMAGILSYLANHDPPVVHRDFTPDNLVLRPDGQLVLIDFGAANHFLENATGTLVGKQCYMSIEQVKGKATPESDLYGMGASLYFLLTGHDPPPLQPCHPRAISTGLSHAIDDLVAQLTSATPAERLVALESVSPPAVRDARQQSLLLPDSGPVSEGATR